MLQLLNPKTAIRNIGGNLGFAALENIKDAILTYLEMEREELKGAKIKEVEVVLA